MTVNELQSKMLPEPRGLTDDVRRRQMRDYMRALHPDIDPVAFIQAWEEAADDEHRERTRWHPGGGPIQITWGKGYGKTEFARRAATTTLNEMAGFTAERIGNMFRAAGFEVAR